MVPGCCMAGLWYLAKVERRYYRMGGCRHGLRFGPTVADRAAEFRRCGLVMEVCVGIHLGQSVVKMVRPVEVQRRVVLAVTILTADGREVNLKDFRRHVLGRFLKFPPDERPGESLQNFVARMLREPGCLHIIGDPGQSEEELVFQIHHKPEGVDPVGVIAPSRLWNLVDWISA